MTDPLGRQPRNIKKLSKSRFIQYANRTPFANFWIRHCDVSLGQRVRVRLGRRVRVCLGQRVRVRLGPRVIVSRLRTFPVCLVSRLCSLRPNVPRGSRIEPNISGSWSAQWYVPVRRVGLVLRSTRSLDSLILCTYQRRAPVPP